MKLIADVKPRNDGTVNASVGTNKYVFKAAEDGRLTADVPDADADVLLDTGNFYPAAEEDSGIDVAAAKAAQLDAAAAALDAAKAAHDAGPTEETAAALVAAQEAFDAAAADPVKPKAKGKSKSKKK